MMQVLRCSLLLAAPPLSPLSAPSAAAAAVRRRRGAVFGTSPSAPRPPLQAADADAATLSGKAQRAIGGEGAIGV